MRFVGIGDERMKTIVVALGGNALIAKGQKGTTQEQLENLRVPMRQIAQLSRTYRIVITHGNGPQVGNILLQQEATDEVPKMPLGICVAMTQGQIGYMIESVLDEELTKLGISDDKLFLTVLTYAKVDENDPAFRNPTKPIGPTYSDPIPGYVRKTPQGYRRLVSSPMPIKTYQRREIKRLVEMGFIVIACGGGGIPVFKRDDRLSLAEAVIDKDLASARLAEEIGAQILLILADVERVALNYRQPNQVDLKRMRIEEAERYLEEGQFPAGSMGPKVQAAISFLKAGGERAIISHLEKMSEALNGKTGTEICR